MMLYASRTGTQRNLAEIRRHGWRLLLSPAGVLRTEGFPYALDNGAWSSREAADFDAGPFVAAVTSFGHGADWIALPDIVGRGRESLNLSLDWLPRLRGLRRPLLLPVQDGCEAWTDELPPGIGIFVGGSTAWKWRTVQLWAQWAQRTGRYCHVARVNSSRRVRTCYALGVNSVDGSGVSRFALHGVRIGCTLAETRAQHRWIM